jgi:ABC-type Fe3+/spermidine/putrescine transport system ATPase subunit
MNRPVLELRGVTKRFDEVVACDHVDLEVGERELVTLLGPSGCGKTTTLRCISGSIEPDEGTVIVRDEDVTFRPAHTRNLGLVFQNFALFPHMTVFENVEFPLRVRSVARSERHRRTGDALRLVQLDALADRYPRKLSGGQQQRVGLARALIYRPAIVLFDEPLSNLDAKLRLEMRYEILRLQQELGFAGVYVTHDQEEALSLSDRIAVMQQGVIHQVGTPREIYESPQTAFVAEFVGNPNRLAGRCVERDPSSVVVESAGVRLRGLPCSEDIDEGADVIAFVRPEDLQLAEVGQVTNGHNQLKGSVVGTTYLGEHDECLIRIADGTNWRLRIDNGPIPSTGDTVTVSTHVDRCRVYRA